MLSNWPTNSTSQSEQGDAMKGQGHSIVTAALISVRLFSGVALAAHTEPAKAKKVTLALVNSFVVCDPPSTATQFSGTPACAPALPARLCAFSSSGVGKLSLVVSGDAASGTQVIKVRVSAKGLNPFCEGQQLCAVLAYRATSDDCPEGSCTTGDVTNLGFGSIDTCYFVTSGACKIKGTVDASALQIANSENTGLEIHGCGLKPMGGGFETAVACGILLH